MYQLIPDWVKIRYYILRGRRPWSRGYFTFKHTYIKNVLGRKELLEIFKKGIPLPKGYGQKLDERVVEYPWAISRIPAVEEASLLDAGSTLNFKEIVEAHALQNKSMTFVTLSPEAFCFWEKGISYLFADLRDLPLRDSSFDTITCISTLEHVGMDNSIYTTDGRYKEGKKFDFEKAIREFKRVLKAGGKVLITVPFGKYRSFGYFQQFDSSLVARVLEVFEPKDFHVTYYKYAKEGWNISDQNSCNECEHFNMRETKYFNKKSTLDFDDDGAAASRAVACIEMIK